MQSAQLGKRAAVPLTHQQKAKRRSVFLLLLFLAAAFSSRAQTVTLSVKEAPLETVLQQIGSQTAHQLMYTHEIIRKGRPVTVTLNKVSLKTALERVFKKQPLAYSIDDGHIVVKARKEEELQPALMEVTGRVSDETGAPLAGATVQVQGSALATATNSSGLFRLQGVEPDAVLVISSVGYRSRQVSLEGRTAIEVQLELAVSTLDETVVIAYGTTTKRLNTGAVSRVSAEEIGRQPVSNPLASLYGLVPGLTITQSGGMPNAPFHLQIRGRTSIDESLSNDDPLIIIDGVPFAPNNNNLNLFGNASNGFSPLQAINPLDIESIEVLKDADATAIYGSRGANGVILITTKKAAKGKTRVQAQVYSGFSTVTRTMDLLNTQQYLGMRREAFANDGGTPTLSNAPDLMAWDTTRYTDFKKLLIGGKARLTDAQVSLGGGSEQTRFRLGFGYNRQSTVFPGDLSYQRGSMHWDLNHGSRNKRFSMNFKGSFSTTLDNTTPVDLTSYLRLSPNLPSLYDSSGKLKWSENGVEFDNPLAYLSWKYSAKTYNLLGNILLNYKIGKKLWITSSLGYNQLQTDEFSGMPISGQKPSSSAYGTADFGNAMMKSWIIEPQIQYTDTFGKSTFSALVGTTWQQNTQQSAQQSGRGYTSDALLRSLAAAASVTTENTYGQYRYSALFGRIQYNYQNRYLLHLSGRRDGSSRFGAQNQFANFGAVGAGWIFSSYSFVQRTFPALSFGKVRGSYGLTGNDKIGDYQFLDTWQAPRPYGGASGLYPSALFNPSLAWEVSKKLEGAIELGFFRNSVLLSAAYYRIRSSNGLISYSLPFMTGFTAVRRNWNAVVENSGVEIEAQTRNIQRPHFSWQTSLNITIPRNRLVAFPGLEESSYFLRYVIGEPLSTYRGVPYLGVDPETGVHSFLKKDGSTTHKPSNAADAVPKLGNREIDYFGGLQNTLRVRQFSAGCLIEFRRQTGMSYLASSSYPIPGTMFNQPAIVLGRWQEPGDRTDIQKFTTTSGTDAFAAAQAFRTVNTNGKLSDASFLRLRNVSLAYDLSEGVLERLHLEQAQFYIRGQNLLTLTRYKGADPETQDYFRLPPLKTFTAGVQITF